MSTHALSLRLSSRLAAMGIALVTMTGRAQQSAILDAPTVPMAPTLPDAAVIREPLQPAASQEMIEERPSAQHIWVAGHWRWQDNRYAWIAGRWELPPRANVVWVEPRWDHRGSGYVLTGGYWQDTAPTGAAAAIARPSSPAPIVAAPTTPQPIINSPSPTTIVVEQPPPPPMREYIIERPSPRHVWIDGYWAWRGGRHVWINGHWETPPRERVTWVEPHWERRANGYVFIDGFWRDEGAPVGFSMGGGDRDRAYDRDRGVVVMREGPPPPRREFVDERYRPSPYHIWMAGYWRHDGRAYVWMPGHWDLPPRGYREWSEPRWERRNGTYIFVEGHWH